MLEEAREQLGELWDEAERKRQELLRAIREGEVRDPVSGSIFTIAALKAILITTAISAAASIGTGLLMQALTPRQKSTTGQLQGTLQVPQSDQGLFISEGYGGDPASNSAAWQALHAYAAGARVIPTTSNGYYYKVSIAGITGATEPAWPTTKNATVSNGAATFRCAGRTGGGFKLGMLIVWTGGIVKHTHTTRGGGGGGKGPKAPETTTIDYSVSMAIMPGRGPLAIKQITANTDVIYQDVVPGATGVYDPVVPPDTDYPENTPPSPLVPYTRPTARYSGSLLTDGTGTQTGTILSGNQAGIAIYPGNTTQLPDPTMEADVDARYGAGSTPAFIKRCLVVLKDFYLTRFGGGFPLINFIAEHLTLFTFQDIAAHFCSRTGVLTSSDYDFSGLSDVDVRGFVIGQRYEPASVMEELARIYNAYFFESDKIYGRVRGSVAKVATITVDQLGWVAGEAGNATAPLQIFDSTFPTETDVPRRVDFKFIDPDKNFEQNTQGDSRQVTTSERVEPIMAAVTLYADEAREVSQRELYREQVESEPDTFQLDWTYLWVQPGDSVEVDRDGFAHQVFITSIKPDIGVIEVAGVAEDSALYTQPVSTSGGAGSIAPPVPIPGMTLVGFYDGPLLRDEENTNNNGAGVYAWAVKRNGDGIYNGSALFVDRGLDDELIAQFDTEATFGVTASVLTATTSVIDFVADTVTVDLHNLSQTLQSSTLADLVAGDNACIIGNEVCQILSASREPDTATYPNRWYLTIGLRARRGTDFAVDTHASGERFVLINDAILFIPLNVNELNVQRSYRMVTAGQSLDDAANILFTWTGGSIKPLAPLNVTRRDDASFNSLIEWQPRLRLGHGLHGGLSGFEVGLREIYDVEIYSDSTRATVKHYIRVEDDLSEAVRVTDASDIDSGGLATNSRAISVQRMDAEASTISVRLADVQTATPSVGLVDFNGSGYVQQDDGSRPFSSNLLFTCGVDTTGLYVLKPGGGTYYAQGLAYADDTADVVIEIAHGAVRFYLNPYTGSSELLFTLPFTDLSVRDLRAYFYDALNAGARVTNRVMTNPQRHLLYKAADQVSEFGATQATEYVNIYRVDARVGRGYPAKATLVR